MRNIIDFIIRFSSYFLFIFYFSLSIILLVTGNSYQRSLYFTASSTVLGGIDNGLSSWGSYFGLHTVNKKLVNELAIARQKEMLLEEEVRRLRSMTQQGDKRYVIDSNAYSTTSAIVIRNTITRLNNYITIDKGSSDGIAPNMAVFNQNGVVGVVSQTSSHYSLVISLLNPKLRLSSKIKNSNYFGSLVWPGNDCRYAYLEELPHHVEYNIGDTIVTSGYSSIFPQGIMIGVIDKKLPPQRDGFVALKVRLATDFGRLDNVVVMKSVSEERIQLENKLNTPQHGTK